MRNIVSPYLFLTIIFSLVVWPLLPRDPSPALFNGNILSFGETVFQNFVSGTAMFQLYYIPVLIVLYVCTPIIAILVARPRFHWVVLLLTMAPLVISREGINFNLSTTIYFLGAYTLGIYVGANYVSALKWLQHKFWWLVSLGVLLSIVLITFSLMRFGKDGFTSLTESVFYLQKISLAGVTLVLLNKWETSLPKWLMSLADYSFSIFFLHALFLYGLLTIVNKVLPSAPGVTITLIIALGLFVICILASIAIAAGLKRFLKHRSRYFTGV